ncbi:MAG: TonB-dependent receptor plug domain-containing protein, partial [Steroidobacteraceae bacterium]
MSSRKPVARAVRAALLGGTVTAVAATLPAQAAEESIQEVIVTGSRIARPNLEGTTPVLAIGQQDFAALGMENIADVAAALPQFSPAFGASRTQSTFSGAAVSGLNQVNLRNLTGIRTVVLVNGRRMIGGQATSTSVDFNTIPTANIERIEVLTGGAAAIYGADAVAGVINVITDKDFNGVELGASYGVTADEDNENPSAHLRIGGAFAESGHGQLTVQYDKQGRVSCADRFICEEDFFWGNPAQAPLRGPAAYSGVGLNGRFFLPGVAGPGFVRRGDSFGNTLIPFEVEVDGYN